MRKIVTLLNAEMRGVYGPLSRYSDSISDFSAFARWRGSQACVVLGATVGVDIDAERCRLLSTVDRTCFCSF